VNQHEPRLPRRRRRRKRIMTMLTHDENAPMLEFVLVSVDTSIWIQENEEEL